MADFRYDQFCPVARACEVLSSRWTLLIVRDLMACGPRRFSDLREGLVGISPSVLSERLDHLEANHVVERRELPPPAASTVYALTEVGQALRPALVEFVRWGLRFMTQTRPDDFLETQWVPMGLEACARKGPVPELRLALELRSPREPVPVLVTGGPEGTRVREGRHPAEHGLDLDPKAALMLAAGMLPLEQAEAAGLATARGDRSVLVRLPELFEMPPLNPQPESLPDS